jgi:hypothetical protein
VPRVPGQGRQEDRAVIVWRGDRAAQSRGWFVNDGDFLQESCEDSEMRGVAEISARLLYGMA